MTLRSKFTAYLLFIHVSFAAVIVYLLWDHRIWLIAVEGFYVISFIIALKLFRGLFRPLELLAMGIEVMKEQDFSSRLRTLGHPEMDNLIGVYNQMVDHLRNERIRLQEQHYFLEKVLNATPAAIITLDYDGKISYVNPAAETLLNIRFDELKGKSHRKVNSPIFLPFDSLEAGGSAVIPFHGVRKIKCHKSTFIDQGFPRTFFLIEELTEELRKTEKAAYERLIRMLSHEVNNSIGAANSLLHSCLHYKDQLREEDREDFETAISVAISRTEHLNSFMKSFADIVKLPLPRKEETNVRELLEHVIAFFDAEFKRRNITIVREYQHDPGMILLDRNQIEQVLINVLKNAMEAIKMNGTISIRLDRAGARSIIMIEDTGSGIDTDARQHLFTPFYSTKENGQGIGLTLVQEILTHHKFEFSLESATGENTRFTIYLG